MRYQSEELIPIRISKELNCTFVTDLLLLSDGSAYHYVLINDLTKLVNFIRKEHHATEMKSAENASTLALPTTFYVDIKKFAIDKMAMKSRCQGPTTIDMCLKTLVHDRLYHV